LDVELEGILVGVKHFVLFYCTNKRFHLGDRLELLDSQDDEIVSELLLHSENIPKMKKLGIYCLL